ncbi:hypothetical protein OEB99_06240 [Actinotalea sp. M2MS4P-6]|uniref:hypothetical protein n=1 Tax=Actinotalea sp. M2MS4P-6 TaxID=2983762 RepID=UPI0021E38FB6|nr:hypothetical protein [Actinotalea sp. M2MS4P-6]MCV2393901.1 hypothetical protein [Actinotalea sp. M2MS4P-6]
MVVVVLLGFAASLELVTAGAAGPVGSPGPHLVYRWTWWVPPALVTAAAAYVAVSAGRGLPTGVAVVAGVIAVGSGAGLHLKKIADDSRQMPRRSISRDPNRGPRVTVLALAAVLVILAAVLA